MRIVAGVTRHVQISAGGANDLGYRVVWCPKYRRPVLGGRVAVRWADLVRVKAAERGRRMVALEIVPDHMHLLVNAHRSGSPSRVASQVTGFSSRYLRAGFAHLRSQLPALWSRSYVVATVGALSAQTVRWYTGTQAGRRWRTERPW